MGCVFCEIIKGNIPAYKIHEDDDIVAFLDIHPINPGHVLVIPKMHVNEFQDLDDKIYTDLMLKAKEIAKNIKLKLSPKRVGLMIAGFDVPHAHIHVVPMNDCHDVTSKKLFETHRLGASNEELKQILKKLI